MCPYLDVVPRPSTLMGSQKDQTSVSTFQQSCKGINFHMNHEVDSKANFTISNTQVLISEIAHLTTILQNAYF